MKSFVLSAVLVSLLIVGIAGKKCDDNAKVKSILVKENGGARLVGGDDTNLSSFINAQFKTSYKYLLMSMNFNTFVKDRPGFNKLFRAESDKLFEDSISLAKHLTSRGYEFKSNANNFAIGDLTSPTALVVNVDEMKALETGVRKQKTLVGHALTICEGSDKEIQHYFQEKILKDYTGTLRKFSGYFNNLNNFGATDYKLGVHLFDEYLQKQ